MEEDELSYGMTTTHLKRIWELERENQKLKGLVAEERLAGKLKDELLKKKWALEKKTSDNEVQSSRPTIKNGFTHSAGIGKSQYYNQKQEGKPGRKPSENVI